MPELAAYLFLVSLLLSSLATPIAIHLGRRWGVLDHPGPRKIHQEPTPITGGWAIFIVFSLVMWGHLLLAIASRNAPLVADLPLRIQHFLFSAPSMVSKAWVIYVSTALVFFLGLVDDILGLSVRARLLVHIGIACLIVAFGVRPSLGFLPHPLAWLIGVVWIVGITNAFNFLDGLDGLSTGIALVSTTSLISVLAMGNQPDIVFLLATFAGVQLGFLRYNWHPARVFLGSSGSLVLGHLLAVITCRMTFTLKSSENWLFPLLVPVLILAIPIYDTASVILIRIRERRKVTSGDQSHFHHRLMRLGFSHMQAVVFLCAIAFAIGLSAVGLVNSTLGRSFLVLTQISAIFFILILAERVAAKARGRYIIPADLHDTNTPPPTAADLEQTKH